MGESDGEVLGPSTGSLGPHQSGTPSAEFNICDQNFLFLPSSPVNELVADCHQTPVVDDRAADGPLSHPQGCPPADVDRLIYDRQGKYQRQEVGHDICTLMSRISSQGWFQHGPGETNQRR